MAGAGACGGEDGGPNPTDRAKNGVKRSLLVAKAGGPLAITIAGANVPDAKLLTRTIEAIVLERPEPEPDYPQHRCLDQGGDARAKGKPLTISSNSRTGGGRRRVGRCSSHAATIPIVKPHPGEMWFR